MRKKPVRPARNTPERLAKAKLLRVELPLHRSVRDANRPIKWWNDLLAKLPPEELAKLSPEERERLHAKPLIELLPAPKRPKDAAYYLDAAHESERALLERFEIDSHLGRVRERQASIERLRQKIHDTPKTLANAQQLKNDQATIDSHREQIRLDRLRLAMAGIDLDAELVREAREPARIERPALPDPTAASPTDEQTRPSPPVLAPNAQNVLKALLALNAVNSDKRQLSSAIANTAWEDKTRNGDVIDACVKLKIYGYVESIKGPGGGYWLTPQGQQRARELEES
jgi:hypothetical protein